MILPKIYPITDARLTLLSHTKQIKKLIESGAEFIQLREKSAATDSFYEDALNAVKVAHASGAKLIINDRVDIALATGADGVHLGQNDLPPEEARRVLGDEAIIGFSTHNLDQVIQATKLPIDYIAIGPVFETSTKNDTDPAVGLEGITRIREVIQELPLVAIGGINFNNFCDVLAAGADSVAIISGILTPPEKIGQTFRKFDSYAKV